MNISSDYSTEKSLGRVDIMINAQSQMRADSGRVMVCGGALTILLNLHQKHAV